MSDLITWLRAQLDADTAEIATHPDGEDEWMAGELQATEESNYPCAPYLRISKARALAEVDAKRRIVDDCERTLEDEDYGYTLANKVLRTLALPYADRPGYRPEWAPDA